MLSTFSEAEVEAARLSRLLSDESTALNKDTGKKALSRVKYHKLKTTAYNKMIHVSILFSKSRDFQINYISA